MCHLTPQSMPPYSTRIFPFVSLFTPWLSGGHLKTHTVSPVSINTHPSQLGKHCNQHSSCECNSFANVSKMLSSPHSVHTTSLVMHNALWWILGWKKKCIFFWVTSVELNCLSGSVSSNLHFVSQTFKLKPAPSPQNTAVHNLNLTPRM